MNTSANRMQFKVRDTSGAMRMQTQSAEDAAMCVAFLGNGAVVTHGNDRSHVVWTQGADGDAGESYDTAAEVMHARIEEQIAKLQSYRDAVRSAPTIAEAQKASADFYRAQRMARR